MKVLLYDIETSPLITYSWQVYEADAIEVIEDFQILTVAWKWLGEKKVHCLGQDDFKDYKPGVNNDKNLVRHLRELFDASDVVCGHNSDAFDNKVSQARMMVWGLSPPSPYKRLDTKKIAKKHGRFTSNKLDHLGKNLGLGQKLDNGGFKLWKGVMAGEKKSWAMMKKYNKQDVVLLEQLYLKLLPWIDNHPNLALLDGRPEACPNCGIEGMMQKRGKAFSNSTWYHRLQCMNCKSWHKQRLAPKQERTLYV